MQVLARLIVTTATEAASTTSTTSTTSGPSTTVNAIVAQVREHSLLIQVGLIALAGIAIARSMRKMRRLHSNSNSNSNDSDRRR